MQCPSKLVKNGNSPQGNNLIAHFDKDSFPASVRVVLGGTLTNDINSINGNSGVWMSKEKYTSTEVALQLLDQAGAVLNTCKFDISGQPAPGKDAQIEGSLAQYSGGESVNVSWKSNVEVELRSYVVERQYGGSVDKVLLVAPKGANQNYSVLDDEVYSDISSYKYQISAVFNDNSKVLLSDLSVASV